MKKSALQLSTTHIIQYIEVMILNVMMPRNKSNFLLERVEKGGLVRGQFQFIKWNIMENIEVQARIFQIIGFHSILNSISNFSLLKSFSFRMALQNHFINEYVLSQQHIKKNVIVLASMQQQLQKIANDAKKHKMLEKDTKMQKIPCLKGRKKCTIINFL